MKTPSIKAIIATVGLCAGTVTGVYAAWPIVGWTTPNQHLADIEEAAGGIKEFRDEWKCDEYDEELRDKLREQARLSERGLTDPDLDEDIRRLREKMSKLNCDRFEN